MRRERRSAKNIVEAYANELLSNGDKDAPAKLLAIETIAFRMGWNQLYERLRFGKQRPSNETEKAEPPRPWWID